jgi:hypothetical protein
MDIKTAAMMAASHVLISKPFKKKAVIFKIIALTTKVKSPSVKILIGRVRTPMSTEAIRAEENPEIIKPGTK